MDGTRRRYGVCAVLLAQLHPGGGVAATTLWQAIQNGKPDLYMRYRFEYVEDAQQPRVKDAYANTLRTAVGYGTGLFHGLGAYVQLEDIRALGNETFSDGGANRVRSRATVVDYLFGVKYAQYRADGNALNVARNGAASAGKQAFDLDKLWAWVEFRF